MLRLVSLLFLLLLSSCTREERSTISAPVSTPAISSEPLTRPGTLRVEGEQEPVTLRKVEVPEAPFTTFVPEGDFDVTREADGAVRFTARFGGVPSPEAYALFGFPDDASTESVRSSLLGPGGRFSREGWRVETGPPPCLWAEEGVVYRDASGAASGLLCLGTHAGSPFYLLTHHPEEYGDGFSPRLDVMLEEFRWRDTGTPLGGETSLTR